MGYQLLAADMDGTLLNSEKTISEENRAAINRALALGKQVVFSTGRCRAELEKFFALFPRMRYVLGESGAWIYDLQEQRTIRQMTLPQDTARRILEYAAQRDIMIQALVDGRAIMRKADVAQLSHFHMAHYETHFRSTGVLVDDVCAVCRQADWRLEKICLYHTTAQARARTRDAVQALPVTPVFSEETSLELTPIGADKGAGLAVLCAHLGIPLAQTIAVGDSFNDLTILQTAGLAVAMGNAAAEIRAACDVTVADNDSHGVRQAIETYLLDGA